MSKSRGFAAFGTSAQGFGGHAADAVDEGILEFEEAVALFSEEGRPRHIGRRGPVFLLHVAQNDGRDLGRGGGFDSWPLPAAGSAHRRLFDGRSGLFLDDGTTFSG